MHTGTCTRGCEFCTSERNCRLLVREEREREGEAVLSRLNEASLRLDLIFRGAEESSTLAKLPLAGSALRLRPVAKGKTNSGWRKLAPARRRAAVEKASQLIEHNKRWQSDARSARFDDNARYISVESNSAHWNGLQRNETSRKNDPRQLRWLSFFNLPRKGSIVSDRRRR